MKKMLVPLFALVASVTVSYADSWPWPTEKDYFSANGRVVAHVTPPKYLQKDEPLLEVFVIRATERVPLWQHKMGNLKAPVEVYVSNDGECVVSINEHGRIGYGDYVVAFYGKDGRIRNYSMEQVLHLRKDISPLELFRLIPHSVSSRWWDRNSIKFFDAYGGDLYFCVWLHLFDRWIAWDPTSGEELAVSDEMIQKWNNKARLWCIKEIEKSHQGDTAYEFLAKLKNPEDRFLIEELLLDEKFSAGGTHSRTVRPPSADGRPVYHLERYYCSSARRLLAERLLASWDGRPTDERASFRQPLYYLGKLEGVVTLPTTDDPNKATLWIYLIPSSVSEGQWHIKPPVHHLIAAFTDIGFRNFDLEHTQNFPFGITGVTPGEYWVKTVLDRTQPLSKRLDRIYLPQQGDYQSIDSPVIAITAGETIQNLTIDCTHQVADGTD